MTQPTRAAWGRCLRALLLVGLLAGSPAAILAENAVTRSSDDRTLVQEGVQLERGRRWLDAIEHYEAALERSPENDELQYGLRRAKIHFGIERRYGDGSFEGRLLANSRAEALAHFDDVLGQVRENYVEPLSITSFVAHGTESLYLALGNDRFRTRQLQGVDEARIAQLRKRLREQFWNKPVADRNAARQTVNEVADLGERTLGLAPSAVIMEYVFGGCNALDDYSNYLTPDRLEDLYGNIEGEFVGLGIEMKAEPGKGLLLVDVLSGSPAEEGGLLAGEYVTSVDGHDCRDVTTDEGAKWLRGLAGSRVRLRVRNPDTDAEREGSFPRRAVQVKSIPVAEIVDRTNGIAYLRMTGFQKTTVDELDAALRRLRGEGMRALIWDVRGNPGGLLTTAVEVLDRFIPEGTLVSTKGRSQEQNWSYAAHRPGTWDLPLVLLVDENSASASEIVAGAVRDHRRGTIVGRKTYGKWSVQSIFPLRGETGLRLTTAKFYSPHGLTHGKVGVQPHVQVDLADGPQVRSNRPDPEHDADLRTGRELLVKSLASR
jgi:carboxyl-terminal processing protease